MAAEIDAKIRTEMLPKAVTIVEQSEELEEELG
jgi:hypothetical protein